MNQSIARKQIGTSVVELIQGDITGQDTDAIANAANSALMGGGGVDGAIHRAAGPDVMDELKRKYSRCPTGSAVITHAGKLKASYIIHAVGPRYRGTHDDRMLLENAYRSSLRLCSEHKIRSVAFPSISTGVYGYPVEEAAGIALVTVVEYLKYHPEIRLVRFVLFDKKTYNTYEKTLKDMPL